MRTTEDLRKALTALEREAPAMASVMPRRSPRRRWYLAGGIATAATAAAAAIGVAAVLPSGSTPSAAKQSAAGLTARTVLLTSAEHMAHAQAAAGAYWYVKQRDYATTHTEPTMGHPEGTSYGATISAIRESWVGQGRLRTTVNEGLVTTFASAAGKARWAAAGKPALATFSGYGQTARATSDVQVTARSGGRTRWGVGSHQLTLAQLAQLPATASKLGKTLRQMWLTEPDKTDAVVGRPNPTFAQYVFAWAESLLPEPVRPGTKAAICQLLAQQSGLSTVPGVRDSLGRTGVAIGAGGADDYLVIQPGTGQLIAQISHPLRANTAIALGGNDVLYETIGWTSQLGVSP